jgi:DNA-binding NarL/FixJ family response regulator
MNDIINVLIVEDEPLTIGNLKTALNILSEEKPDLEFKIRSARNCDAARSEITKAIHGKPFDLVLLDISIPESKDRKYLSGEDLGVKIKREFPSAKIIVFTFYTDNYRLNNILQSLNPDGFMIKYDIDFKTLLRALETVIYEPPFYSQKILKLLRQTTINDFTIDQLDRRLLYELSQGTKTSQLPQIVKLSKGGVERRKRHLKEVFDIPEGDDRALIKTAKAKGFI